MEIYSKAALAVLALALSCGPTLAQGDPQDPPPAQQGGPDGWGGGGHGWSGRDGGGWGHGQMRGGWGRGDGMGRHGFGGGGRGFGFMRLLNDPAVRQQVGITDEQAAKIRQQATDFRKAEIRNRADLAVKRIDLQNLMAADKPDRAAIDSKLQEISASQLAMAKSAVDFRLNMRDAITPEQRAKLRQVMKDRWSRDGRGGPGGRGGPRGAGRGGHRGPGGAAPAPGSQGNPPGGAAPGN